MVLGFLLSYEKWVQFACYQDKNQDIKQKHRAGIILPGYFMPLAQHRFLLQPDLNHLNATRTSVTGEGWTEPNIQLIAMAGHCMDEALVDTSLLKKRLLLYTVLIRPLLKVQIVKDPHRLPESFLSLQRAE